MAKEYIAGEAALWLQPDGANTKPLNLGCHGVEDITDPSNAGEITLLYCPDEADVTKYKVSGSFVTPSTSPASTSVSTRVSKVMDALEASSCQGNLFIHKFSGGRRDLFSNYERSFALYKYQKGETTYSAMASMEPDSEEKSTMATDLQAERVTRIVPIDGGRESHAAIAAITCLASLYDSRCQGTLGAAVKDGDWMLAGTEGAAAAAPQVWIKSDGVWAQTAADPGAVDDDISAIGRIPLTSAITRIVATCGTTDAAAPAELSYSDDLGATWTNVIVGTTNAQYITSMCIIDQYNIWVGCEDGEIYKSDDAALTWTMQHDGTLGTDDIRAIKFVSTDFGVAVGDANLMLATYTGGTAWALITGAAGKAADNILDFYPVTEDRWFLGYDDGEIYYTEDGGRTWAQRRFLSDSVGAVNAIEFVSDLVGYVVHDSAAPVARILRTIDGGYSFDAITIPANTGLADLVAFGPNLATAGGALTGAVATVIQVA